MNRRYLILQYILLSALAWGCRKDVEEFRPYVPTQEDLTQLFTQVPAGTTHTIFQFGGTLPDTTLTTSAGVRIFLADTEHLFEDETGTEVPCSTCPNLKIEITTVLSKGDLIARGLTTATSDSHMLESVGMVELRATCGGKPLFLQSNRYVKVQIPAPEVKPDMAVFEGVFDTDLHFTGWNQDTSKVYWADWTLPGGIIQTGYELIDTHLGWSNCARPIDEQSSSFCVTLPGQFNTLNTRVFLVFQNIRAVAELSGNDSSPVFCFSGAPLGYPVKVVAISKTGGQYWLVNHFTEIGSNVQLTLSPIPQSEKDILTFFKGL